MRKLIKRIREVDPLLGPSVRHGNGADGVSRHGRNQPEHTSAVTVESTLPLRPTAMVRNEDANWMLKTVPSCAEIQSTGRRESLGEISNEIVEIFEADGEADEAIADAAGEAFGMRQCRV